MPATCVVGLQWGDEAKGKIVDLLTEQHDIVVRYQGGANAGHTVVCDGQTFKLSLVPSGIFRPEVQCVIAGRRGHQSGQPAAAKSTASSARGVQVGQEPDDQRPGPRDLSLARRGRPPDERIDQRRGHRHHDARHRPLLSRQGRPLATPSAWATCIAPSFAGRDRTDRRRPSGGSSPASAARTTASSSMRRRSSQQYHGYAERLRPYVADTTAYLLDAVEADKRVLFEGAQGALLDIDHGTFPFVTSSNSSGVGVSGGSGVPGRYITKVIGIVKAYTTRVGGGPFPTEQDNATGQHIRDRGNEYGTVTRRPRRCGWFDAVAARYTARLSGVDVLAVMLLDVLSELPELKICTAYEFDGQRITEFPRATSTICAGWCRSTKRCPAGRRRSATSAALADLPQRARDYLDRLSELVGRPVEVVSVGPDRQQTIFANDVHNV